jgi:hypothetical protein
MKRGEISLFTCSPQLAEEIWNFKSYELNSIKNNKKSTQEDYDRKFSEIEREKERHKDMFGSFVCLLLIIFVYYLLLIIFTSYYICLLFTYYFVYYLHYLFIYFINH